ncbi:peptide alpha-N-acetyltransferase [Nematocida displodere]|uniref:Peptide alpha-N-acetyltransferase n=1 Tax=Nematocida displodere TaxID=1805483 RepID=A0A177EJ79_9MICR|nr:peptide alpha-N-acetyltransferase [Nematocida displodere]
MVLSDLPQVKECNRSNLPEAYNFLFMEYIFLVSPGASFVAENHQGEVVGYALGKLKDELEKDELIDTSLPVGYVASIGVDRGYRGKGIGQLLFAAVLHGLGTLISSKQEAAKEMRVYLNVRESNGSAIGLYQKFGFFTESKQEAYYPNNETALLMSRVFCLVAQ